MTTDGILNATLGLALRNFINSTIQSELIANDNETGLISKQPFDEEYTAFITEEMYERFEYICSFIISPILCTFGIVTNCLGIGVLWQDTKQKMSIYFFLFALTLSDIIYLALGLIRIFPEVMKQFDFERAELVGAQARPTIIYFDMVFSHTSTAMIIVMSIERLLALVRPLTVKQTWFAKYPITIILSSFFLSALFPLPYPICMNVISFQSGNGTGYYIAYRRGAQKFMEIYDTVQTVINQFLPFVCLLATNIAIPIKYYGTLKHRLTVLKGTSGQMMSQQIKITSTVIAVSFMYVLLVCPLLISKTLPYIDHEYSFTGRKKVVFWFLIELSNLFTYANAANDLLLYIMVSNHYRAIFRQKFCGCFLRQSSYINRDTVISIDVASDQH